MLYSETPLNTCTEEGWKCKTEDCDNQYPNFQIGFGSGEQRSDHGGEVVEENVEALSFWSAFL
jgi:hypothetical protein